jgi:CBS domain containing-hemolysin-like protein
MSCWLYIFIIMGSYLSAYVVSLYSLAVYLDPEEIDTLMPHMSQRRRRLVLKLADDPRALVQIATIYKSFSLILITVMATLCLKNISLMVDLSASYLYPIGLILIWFLYLLFIEYLPRRSSRKVIDSTVPRYLWMVTSIYFLFLPVVSVYRHALTRIKPEEQPTEDEKEEIVERAIESLADQAGIGEALVEEDEKKMIGQIFLLDQTVAREIMIPRIDIVGIDRSMNFKEIQQLIREDGHSRFPVYEGTIDHIIGMLYVKDLLNKYPQPGEEFVITKYLRKPYFVPDTKIIGDLMREFKATKLHIAIVIDEYGGVSGLVTLEDILEEIVGEIQDEHDTEESPLTELPDGSLIIDAGLSISELQEKLDTDHDPGDFDTVGGLVYFLTGVVPRIGAIVHWYDIEFEVVKIDGPRLKQIRVTRQQPRTI